MRESVHHPPETDPGTAPHLTVLGLFEDSIDAEHTLSDFRKAAVPPETVSVLASEKQPGASDSKGGSPAVEVSLAEIGLGAAGDWLTHLVSIVIPDAGVFLMAGPIGAIVAATEPNAQPDHAESQPGMVHAALVRFGYGTDEAGYIASRLLAGSILIGLTTADADLARETRRIFADQSAVHIGTNWTENETAMHAQRLVHTPVETAQPEDVIVLDSVGALVALSTRDDALTEQRYRGMPVVDSDGNDAGVIDDLLAEIDTATGDGNEQVHIRYVVLAFGGVLGIGRGRVAVPRECVSLDSNRASIACTTQKLKAAPPYRNDTPFSRHQEELICSYFGCSMYWTRE